MKRIVVVWAVLLGIMAAAARAQQQFFDPDTRLLCWACYSHNGHFAGGVVVDAVVHLPIAGWHKTAGGRIATVAVVGAAYELLDYGQCRKSRSCGQPDRGFGVIDLLYVTAGAVATEAVHAAAKRLWRIVQ